MSDNLLSADLSQAPSDPRARFAPVWRKLDRDIPLGFKVAVPVLLVTLVATVLGGVVVAEQTRQATEAGYIADARATAKAAANDFVQAHGQVDIFDQLYDLDAEEPNIIGIWIVDTGQPGEPVVASSHSGDYGRTGLIEAAEVAAVKTDQDGSSNESQNGIPVLETIHVVPGGRYAVVIVTSLQSEANLVAQTTLWIGLAGLLVALFELGGVAAILEWGVLRRIRRVQQAVASFGRARELRLSEGDEPQGNDRLFNLAREIDLKLDDLRDRERASDVISELGVSALQGASPENLIQKALDLVKQSASLDRCYLVETGGSEVIVSSLNGGNGRVAQAALPVWLGALVRAAARSRRPVMADNLGQDCRFWGSEKSDGEATAAFVPLAGNPDPIGVMVGVARPGRNLSPAVVSLMESVAITLGEVLQRNAADQARRESDVKSRALTTVSHEIRNPLNAMLGFSDLLLSEAAGPLNDKQREYLQRLDDASHHLLSLVNDYLNLARIMAGSLPLNIEAVPIEPEVNAVLQLMGPSAASKHVMLHSMIAPDIVARVDKLRLRQVLVNLVSNAIKFTPARGHVRVEVMGGSNGVRISVIDTGLGIPADRQHLIFTEFAELRSGDSAAGSGLGLALTKRFVEAMGGFIRFTSAEGAGTIFDVWLPGESSPRVDTVKMAPEEQLARSHVSAASIRK